ncbi:MAG TPA: alpha/beta fold hydrolase [Pyrinomonadaceae bacterium]|jgi:pimeloyl-ACP methyl ester carboxylesterase
MKAIRLTKTFGQLTPDEFGRLLLSAGVWLLILLLLVCGNNKVLAQASRVESGMAELGNGKLYYEVMGRGRNVVLIHGGLADSRLWDDQFKALAKHYRVLRYDLRGFGKSDFSMGPLSHVEDLAALLKFLRIEKASFIGLSLGGMIAMDFALEHPAMVERLVLAASGLRGYQGVKNEKAIAVSKAAETEGREKAIALWLEHPFFATGKSNPSYQQRMREMLTDNFRTWGPTPAPIVWTWPTRPVIEKLQAIKAPTLVIVGDMDFSNITAIADILAAKIPGAKKAVMTNVSHHLNMEKPQEFNQLVLSFLRRK